MSELIKADNEYKEWIAEISTDFRKSQIRASMKINDEMLRFYWKLGKGISSMREQFGYGMGFYKTVSDDLKSILPDVIVGFPLIVMQGCDTVRSVSLSEMVCKYLQQSVWRILRKRFRQGYDQFPCSIHFPSVPFFLNSA